MISFPATNKMFKGNNRNTRTRREICSKLKMETPERRCCISYRNLRSSRPEVFSKKGVPRNFAKFAGKHLCQSLFFNIVAGLRPATLLKKEALAQAFPVSFVKFQRTLFLQNTSERLLPKPAIWSVVPIDCFTFWFQSNLKISR